MDIFKIRKAAGMLTEAEVRAEERKKTQAKNDASPQHKASEHELFKKACADLTRVEEMCSARLNQKDLTDEHKKQYTELRDCAKRCCEDMHKHLTSYK